LVSESDVDSYKQIKIDLDELRLLVEKSELWVFMSRDKRGPDKKMADDVGLVEVRFVQSLFKLDSLNISSCYTEQQTCISCKLAHGIFSWLRFYV